MNCFLKKFRLIKKSNAKIDQSNTNDQDKKNYDILPGVGEIVLWAAKDKRGYLIDINGSWLAILFILKFKIIFKYLIFII